MAYAPAPHTPLADTLIALTAVSFEGCDLPEREIMLARIAALAAVGAPPRSYAVNAGGASSTGLDLEDAQGMLIALAPIIGTASDRRGGHRHHRGPRAGYRCGRGRAGRQRVTTAATPQWADLPSESQTRGSLAR
jgi:hypothetical protein